jgi:hypothetical protein
MSPILAGLVPAARPTLNFPGPPPPLRRGAAPQRRTARVAWAPCQVEVICYSFVSPAIGSGSAGGMDGAACLRGRPSLRAVVFGAARFGAAFFGAAFLAVLLRADARAGAAFALAARPVFFTAALRPATFGAAARADFFAAAFRAVFFGAAFLAAGRPTFFNAALRPAFRAGAFFGAAFFTAVLRPAFFTAALRPAAFFGAALRPPNRIARGHARALASIVVLSSLVTPVNSLLSALFEARLGAGGHYG